MRGPEVVLVSLRSPHILYRRGAAMADPDSNLPESMDALAAERQEADSSVDKIETYKRAIHSLNSVILALTDNMTVVGDPETVTAALSMWRDTLQILKELDARDKSSGWPG